MLQTLHTTLSTKTKMLVGLPLVGLILIGLSIHTYYSWHDKQYFGEIVQVTDTSITISDKRIGTRTLEIHQDTVVKKGRISEVALMEGMSVIITTSRSNNQHASFIRVVEHPPRKSSPFDVLR